MEFGHSTNTQHSRVEMRRSGSQRCYSISLKNSTHSASETSFSTVNCINTDGDFRPSTALSRSIEAIHERIRAKWSFTFSMWLIRWLLSQLVGSKYTMAYSPANGLMSRSCQHRWRIVGLRLSSTFIYIPKQATQG